MIRKSAGWLLLAVLIAAVWGAWALTHREQSAESAPIDARFVRMEVRYEAI